MPAEITSGPMPSAGMEAMLYVVVEGGGATGRSAIEPIVMVMVDYGQVVSISLPYICTTEMKEKGKHSMYLKTMLE